MMMSVAVGGMIGKGNRSTRRKLAPVALCPPQIPHDLTRVAAMGSRHLLIAYYEKKKLGGLSPRANYTDGAKAAAGEVRVSFCG
jgi:hypothetical protein